MRQEGNRFFCRLDRIQHEPGWAKLEQEFGPENAFLKVLGQKKDSLKIEFKISAEGTLTIQQAGVLDENGG